jgi:hypothetical protein
MCKYMRMNFAHGMDRKVICLRVWVFGELKVDVFEEYEEE